MGDELAVGKNRTGEACRLKLTVVREDNGFRRFSLFCDGWTQPSGDVWRFRTMDAVAVFGSPHRLCVYRGAARRWRSAWTAMNGPTDSGCAPT